MKNIQKKLIDRVKSRRLTAKQAIVIKTRHDDRNVIKQLMNIITGGR